MSKVKISVRLLLLLSYFLPFTFFFMSCNGFAFDLAYNRQEEKAIEANNLIKSAYADSAKTTTDTSGVITDTSFVHDSAADRHNINDNSDNDNKPWIVLFFPTKRSLSGLGNILYHKTFAGRVLMAISLALTLFLLLGSRYLKRRYRLTICLFVVNFLCVLIFVIINLYFKVDMLWGMWLLAVLTLLGLLVELWDSRKAYR